jgi:Zn-dependent protease with chaperone function
MLIEISKIIRASFRVRLAIAEIVVISFSIYASVPVLVAKLIALAAFILTGSLFVTNFAFVFLPQIRLTLTHRRGGKIPVPMEIAEMAGKLNVSLKEVRLKDSAFHNAYAFGKSIALGLGLLKDLGRDECRAVVAHELGHIKERHYLIRICLLLPLAAIPIYTWSTIYSPTFFSVQFTQMMMIIMVSIAMLAYINVVMVPINWYLETRADKIARKLVGREPIKAALLVLSFKNNSNPSEPTEDHPSIVERIKLIEKSKD